MLMPRVPSPSLTIFVGFVNLTRPPRSVVPACSPLMPALPISDRAAVISSSDWPVVAAIGPMYFIENCRSVNSRLERLTADAITSAT